MAHIHPPKVELFDVRARTNTDPKGFVRAVDEYRVETFGLYMARAVVDHPRIAYLQSWLLPDLGLRVNDIRHHPHDPRPWDTYVDIATTTIDGDVWRTVDHYLDIGLHTGTGLDVLDTDELTTALLAGLIDPDTARTALDNTFTAVAGIAAHHHNLTTWLSTLDIPLTWPHPS